MKTKFVCIVLRNCTFNGSSMTSLTDIETSQLTLIFDTKMWNKEIYLTKYVELFYCKNEAFLWKFCLNPIKWLEVVFKEITLTKEFQECNCFITLSGQTL